MAKCPDCAGVAITTKGYDCLTCFGSGNVEDGICPHCKSRSLEPICNSCMEMIQRRMEALSFMPFSVVK